MDLEQQIEEAHLYINRLQSDLKDARQDIQIRDKKIDNFKKTQAALQKNVQLHKKRITELQEKLKSNQQGAYMQSMNSQSISKELQMSLSKIKQLGLNTEKIEKQLSLKDSENKYHSQIIKQKQKKILDLQNQIKQLIIKSTNEIDKCLTNQSILEGEIFDKEEAVRLTQLQSKILSNQLKQSKLQIAGLKSQGEDYERIKKNILIIKQLLG